MLVFDSNKASVLRMVTVNVTIFVSVCIEPIFERYKNSDVDDVCKQSLKFIKIFNFIFHLVDY